VATEDLGEEAEWRKRAAIVAFNRTWDLIDLADRSASDEEAMVRSACASRELWEEIGSDEHRFTGDWQIAHVLSLVGDGPLAVRFATLALDPVEACGWTDWKLASAYEGLARAHAALGDAANRDQYAQRSRAMLAQLEDVEGRELIASQLATVPGPDGGGSDRG
jgi:8-oxo-dGTP pyrophosphatase MutT (NUDIX family)